MWSQSVHAVPKIQTWQAPSGAEVLFVPTRELPMVDVRIAFDAGSARDGGKPGLASLTAAMLTQGAGGLDADTVAERVEGVGAELSTGASRDNNFVQVRSLSDAEALEVAVDTLTKVLAEPTFDPSEFERVRENRLTGLRLAEQDPGDVGQKALYRAIFGEHPYASDPSGTAESVAALSVEDLRRFHRRFYGASNATVAIVGDLERAQAEALAARVTADLPSAGPAPPLPPVTALDQASIAEIAFPSSQTHVYAGQPGMRRGDPDYFPLYVGNHILGGSGLVSLLMEEVREKRGLSYSVYSYFAPLARKGPFLMGLQTKTAQAEQAKTVLLDTLARFIDHGPTDAELDAAVRNITGGFPLRIAGNGKIVSYLSVIGFYDLPLDYLDQFQDRIRSVTAEQIRDAFRRRVDPQKLALVMVGTTPESAEAAAAPSAAPPAVVPADGSSVPADSNAADGGQG
jgi:zinc protease